VSESGVTSSVEPLNLKLKQFELDWTATIRRRTYIANTPTD